jgi:nicotinate dehydrogenase subunit A
MNVTLTVNGKTADVEVDDPSMPLLYALRDGLGLRGPRFGCGLAQCGACTVHIDGKAVRSCVYPVSSVGKGKVTTLEGLGSSEHPHPLQQAFIDEQAVQCGYCINGMIMQVKALLDACRLRRRRCKTALDSVPARESSGRLERRQSQVASDLIVLSN